MEEEEEVEREEEYLVLGCNSVVVVVVAGKLEVLELCVRLVVEREEDEDREVERREDGRPSWCVGEAVVVDMGCVWEVVGRQSVTGLSSYFWGAEGIFQYLFSFHTVFTTVFVAVVIHATKKCPTEKCPTAKTWTSPSLENLLDVVHATTKADVVGPPHLQPPCHGRRWPI